ncbi:protein-tyrosine-phosphatase [Sporichthya polymorpha]|uniref:arsenate reductase/protein-tyrosine-phosphatase family protein n=1 Tax=Sporichthya polymorpha TaxID=35751 RepID=UPI00146A671C|nr:protein-tyrosine-phosphatase [Sporichthya polymorpha]
MGGTDGEAAGVLDPGFRILFVCTGNICRSAFAELLTAHFLAERLGDGVTRFALGSAGTQAIVGRQIHPDTRRELEPWKLDGPYADRFVSRQLEAWLVDWADVVLTATPEHRVAVLTLAPQALPKAFALREFARLAASIDPGDLPLDPVERAHALVDRARRKRGTIRPKSADDDAIVDPIGRPQKIHHQAATQIAEAVQTIAEIVAI